MSKLVIKFTIKLAWFSIPFLSIIGLYGALYSPNKGDLLRIGYLADVYNYHWTDIFGNELVQDNYYKNLIDIDLGVDHSFDILNIGDSFANFRGFSYQNYLAQKSNESILNYERTLQEKKSPMQVLSSLLKGDFFNKIKVNYVILEMVERETVLAATNFDSNHVIMVDDIKSLIDINTKTIYDPEGHKFSLGKIKKFLKYNILHFFDDNAINSKVYKVNMTRSLFSSNTKQLLFYNRDLQRTLINNKFDDVLKLNNQLNSIALNLSEKNIKLIVLFPPDKYNIYYPYIENKEDYVSPQFFKHINSINKKEYYFVNTIDLLKKHLEKRKDIYFFDDTHWSPWGSKIIAEELFDLISEIKYSPI